MDEYSNIIIFARYICETKRIRNKITYSLPLGIAMLICVRKSAFFKSRAAHAALLSKMQIYEHILHRDTEAGVNNHGVVKYRRIVTGLRGKRHPKGWRHWKLFISLLTALVSKIF